MKLLTINAIDIVNDAMTLHITQSKTLIQSGAFNIVTISTKQIASSINDILIQLQKDAFKYNNKVIVVKSSTLIGHEYFKGHLANKPEYSYYGMVEQALRTFLNDYGIKLPNNSEISKLIENIDSNIIEFNNIFSIEIGTDYNSTCLLLEMVSPVFVRRIEPKNSHYNVLITSYHFYNLTNEEVYTFNSTKQRNTYLKTKVDLELRKIL